MKKLLLAFFIGVFLSIGISSLAAMSLVNGRWIDDSIVFLRGAFMAGNSSIESFKDSRTGITCYIASQSGTYNSISCVK